MTRKRQTAPQRVAAIADGVEIADSTEMPLLQRDRNGCYSGCAWHGCKATDCRRGVDEARAAGALGDFTWRLR